MPINNITQTISILPPAGRRGIDVQTQFVIKQEDFQDHLQGTTVNELNTLKDQLNSRIGEINSTVTTMNGYANTASAGASTATTKAGEASTSAGEALAYRNQAETFKNNASSSATSASTSASTATTQASQASASATSASTSASTATTQAGIATTKANEASASATSATTSRNQAETFAQQAQASASSVDANNIVHRTGDETIAGVKTFSSNPLSTASQSTNANALTKYSAVVKNTGAETIAGVKTFSSSPIVPTPTTGTQAVNKDYADLKQANLGFTPVQQGTGIGQLGNVVKIGWAGTRTKITIDATDAGNIVMDSDIGVANSSLVKTALNATGTAPIYACRAWTCFNGTSATITPLAGGNVQSITDNGTGDYTVNFTTAMPDANYVVMGTADRDATNTGTFIAIESMTISSVRIFSRVGNGGNTDSSFVSLGVLR